MLRFLFSRIFWGQFRRDFARQKHIVNGIYVYKLSVGFKQRTEVVVVDFLFNFLHSDILLVIARIFTLL